MDRRRSLASWVGICSALTLSVAAWPAQPECVRFAATLYGREEVPPISSVAVGYSHIALLHLEGPPEQSFMSWDLYYPGNIHVTQAHIHFGQPGVNGGIMVFLCTNLGNGPAGTLTCPNPLESLFTDDADPEDVVGPAAQGITPGDFFAFQRAVRQGVAYVNVHTDAYPGGLLRGQLRFVENCTLDE